ncbi:trafficking protein particle complex subunit 10 [Lipomyces kononenkoae]|uniref:Trafficking protein particle complex subunit 10 n=1 Tax=Lipomyces kononenkoae TaxID=34357 RepID=A0ACC3TDK8_LIPKO
MTVTSAVSITYYDPFGVYPHIIKDIQSRLPLRNLHWHDPPRPLRSIASLSINLYEESLNDDVTLQHQIPGLLDTPYMKIMLVKCEDNDTYRASVRKIIREWFSTKVASKRDSTEWLIIYYAPNLSNSSNPALRFKSGVFDKIRSDFNTSSKEDRCMLVKPGRTTVDTAGPQVNENVEAWNEIMVKIKAGVLDAFGKRIRMYEGEAKKLEAKKGIPGWNFATFFVMKEGLALSFENVGLLEDALMQYDELDATFMQLMRDNTVTYFQNVGFSPDSTSSLLSRDKDVSIRHAILENNISLFDFRCYLFSRQALLLLTLMSSAPSPSMAAMRMANFLIRSRNFTLETSRMLVYYGKNPYLVANWVYGVVQEILDATEVETQAIQGGRTRDVAEGRAEVLLLSRSAIERLASRKGWRIGNVDFEDINLNTDTVITTEDDELARFLNPTLKEILSDETSFMTAYMEITDAVMSYYESADRTRSVDKLRAQQAIVKYQEQKYEEAARLLASLPQLYSSQGWELISTNLFLIYAHCLYKLDRKEEYVKLYLQILTTRKYSSIQQQSEICEKIKGASRDMENDMTFSLSSLFSTSVSKQIDVSTTKDDSFYITMEIYNPFDVEWTITTASVRLIEPGGMKHTVLFRSTDEVILPSGRKTVTLQSAHDIPGIYEIDNIEFRMGSLLLVKDYFGDAPLENQRMRLYQQPGNLDVSLSTPSRMRLDDAKKVLIKIHTGWNDIEFGKVIARSASSGLRLLILETEASLKHDDSTRSFGLQHTAEATPLLEFGPVNPESTLSLAIPYIAETETKESYIRVQVEFKTKSQKFYSLSVTRHVSIGLPLAVNVQDIFKASSLFSKFSVSCIGPSTPLRIVSGTLIGNEQFAVSGGQNTARPCVAFPKQPVTYVYSVTQNPKKILERQNRLPLSLLIRYRKLEDEMRGTLTRTIADKLKSVGMEKYLLLVEHHAQALLRCDFTSYGFLNKLVLGKYETGQWGAVLMQIGPTDREIVSGALAEIYDDIPADSEEILATDTKELVILVEIPTVQLLFTVELQYSTDSGQAAKSIESPSRSSCIFSDKVFYIGQAIPVILRLQCSTAWSGNGHDLLEKGDIEFGYEVMAPSDTWIVSGKRKGHFTVSDKPITFPLVIIPIRHGNLLLPTIEVRPSQRQHEQITAEVEYKNNAESVLVLPEVSNVVLAVGE